MDRSILRSFKLKGLSLSGDASRALSRVLSIEEDPTGSLERILVEIKERIEKREINSSLIDVDAITSVVAYLSSSEEDLQQESTQLFDAFNSPKIEYDERTKTFRVEPKPTYRLHGSVDSRAKMFRERLLFTQQRLLRSGLVVTRTMGQGHSDNSVSSNKGCELSTIESLLGSTGTKVLFGMLTQPEEGQWFLEDLDSLIRLDLRGATCVGRLYTEGSLVIIEGELVQGVLKVQVMGFPPAEDRDISLTGMGIKDPFCSELRPAQRQQMLEMEESATDSIFVILSDIQLDRPLVIEKLQKVFEGFEDGNSVPLFILMGNFVSKPARSPGGREAVSACFSALADAIASCPRLATTAKFLLVPGPQDAGTNSALPRRAIPVEFTKDLRKKVTHISFASNPCRVRFYTQEILLFREDLLRKMRRHVVVPPDFDGDSLDNDITQQLVQSILDQAHLCPLPLHVRPVYWDLDYTLRMTPLPHLLILADHAEPFSFELKGCTTVNPGSFSSDYSFLVYRPATRSVEFSRLT